MKRWLLIPLKLIIVATLLTLVFHEAEQGKVWQYVGQLSPLWFGGSVLFSMAAFALGGWRMHYVMHASDINVPLSLNIRMKFINGFLNIVLPGGVSGDAVQIMLMRKLTGSAVMKLVKIQVAERLSGLFFLGVFSLILLYEIDLTPILSWINWLWLVCGIIMGLTYFVLAHRALSQSYEITFGTLMRTLAVQVFWTIGFILLWRATGEGQHAIEYLLLFCVSCIMVTLPITIGGLGVREATFLYGAELLKQAGIQIDAELGIALSLSFFAVWFLAALPGAIMLNDIWKLSKSPRPDS